MYRNRVANCRLWFALLAFLGPLWGLTDAHADSFGGTHFFFSQIFLPPSPVIEDFERLGSSFAIGDFDNDGFDDLAVGEPYAEISSQPDAGQVYVFFSNGSSQTFATPLSFDPGAAQSGVHFGFSLAAGDFNLDGIEDLAIGVPNSSRFFASFTGEVQIRFGGIGGFSGSGQVIELLEPQGGAHFGFSLASAETSSSGVPGLADTLFVGVPGHNFDPGSGPILAAGATAFFIATPSGLTFDGLTFQDAFGGAIEANDFFGETLASGDFNGDGVDDFAIGTPGEGIGAHSNAGAVSFAVSNDKGYTRGTVSQADLPGTAAEAFDGFGTALAIGDFDGDGHDDLAIGTPFEDISSTNEAGLVQVVPGVVRTGLDFASASTWSQESTGVAVSESSDLFGAALQAGDFDGDGQDDLAIGIPFEDFAGAIDTGAVVALFGDFAGGLNSSGAKLLVQSIVGGTNQQGDLFGDALGVGDFDRDGTLDLAVGVPGENSGATDAGAFFVLFGEGLFADGFESGGTTAWSATAP